MNWGMQFVKIFIVIFLDVNMDFGEDFIKEIVCLFCNFKVGCVLGEKWICFKDVDVVVGVGEGIYWKYEFMFKKWDVELYFVVGVVGEFFVICIEFWQEVEKDILLDDFIIFLWVVMQGYIIQYNFNVYVIEMVFVNVKEEFKCKVWILVGGIQLVICLWLLLNIFKYGRLFFQYIFYWVFWWMFMFLLLLLLILVNLVLVMQEGLFGFGMYSLFFWG